MNKVMGVGTCPRCKTSSVWEIDVDGDTNWTCCGYVVYKHTPLPFTKGGYHQI